MTNPDDEPLRLVARRLELLELLEKATLEKPAIRERLDVSRSTVDRAIRELSSAGLVERGRDGYAATLSGRLAAERYRACLSDSAAVFDAADVLEPLPANCDLGVDVLREGDAELAARPAPYRPVERLRESVRAADRYRAVLPVLNDPRHVRLCYERVVTGGCRAGIVVDPDLFDRLRTEFPRQLAAMADTGRFDISVGEVPDYAVVLVDSGGETRVHVVVFDDGGTVHGVVHNDTAAAAAWAREQYEAALDAADPVTDRVASATGAGGDVSAALESEGFVAVSTDYFADRSVADPTDAWRAGLGLAEVQAGYAVDRTAPAAGDGDGPLLTDWLRGRLRQGVDCAVLGPPGSGKSTTCKQVACAWYQAGDPVFYRESGRGRPFESVAALVDAVEAADGRPLVVVEDAVRPEARAAFEALAAVGDSAAFLFDARREEWSDPPGDATGRIDREAVETVSMPRLLGRDCERLVEHFERTVGRDVDVPVDRLRESVRSDEGDGAQPGEALLFTHRLAGHADPLTDAGPTSLESQARAVAADLAAAGDGAVDVGLAVNLLNAAGVAVHPEHLHALVAADADLPAGLEDCRPMAVDAALDRLDGVVLFGRGDDGSYRTVHESWSATFLGELLDADAETAAAPGDGAGGEADAALPNRIPDRVARVLDALFALADDPVTRDRTRGAVEAPALLDRVEDAPAAWASDLLDGLTTLTKQRPKLAPLLPGADDVDLPDACEPDRGVVYEQRLATAHLNAGDGDRADAAVDRMEAALDAVADDLPDDRVRALRAAAVHRRGRADRCRGDLDAAAESYRRALDIYETLDDPEGESNCLNSLGIAADRRGDWEQAVEYYRRSLDRAREADATRLEASRLVNIGLMHHQRGDHDRAEERLREGAAVAREVGLKGDEAQALNNLGVLARDRGDLETAESRFLETLERRRELGIVRGEALALWNLAEVARRRGAWEDARSYARRARDTYESLGDGLGVARSRVVLAHVHHDDGEPETAIDLAERALDRVTGDDGDRLAEASARIVLGKALRAADRLEAAADQLEQASDRCADLGTPLGRAWCRRQRGLLAADRGDHETARDRLSDALDIASEGGLDRTIADVNADLGRLAAARGDHDEARSRFETAVDAYLDCDADLLALDTLDPLVDVCATLGDYEAAVDRCEQGVGLATDLGADETRERFRERCRRLEGLSAD